MRRGLTYRLPKRVGIAIRLIVLMPFLLPLMAFTFFFIWILTGVVFTLVLAATLTAPMLVLVDRDAAKAWDGV